MLHKVTLHPLLCQAKHFPIRPRNVDVDPLLRHVDEVRCGDGGKWVGVLSCAEGDLHGQGRGCEGVFSGFGEVAEERPDFESEGVE